MHCRNLIVGCGLSGAVAARILAENGGEKCLVVDERDHIGGNVYDYKWKDAVTVQKYGPHVFHTSNEVVWRFLSRFTSWKPFSYHVRALVDGVEVPLPFGIASIERLFDASTASRLVDALVSEYGMEARIPIAEFRKAKRPELRELAEFIYKKIFEGYSKKQWGSFFEKLDPSVFGRVPVAVSRSEDYFCDAHEAIPSNGYTELVRHILDHPLIENALETSYAEAKRNVDCDRLFYTGSIDEFFDFRHGELPYRDARLDFKTFDVEYYQSCPQMNHPGEGDFTRSVEYKYYLSEEFPRTIVSFECPCDYVRGTGQRFYPVPSDETRTIHEKYQRDAASLKNVAFFGRLGDYRYYNMDAAVARAMEVAEAHL